MHLKLRYIVFLLDGYGDSGRAGRLRLLSDGHCVADPNCRRVTDPHGYRRSDHPGARPNTSTTDTDPSAGTHGDSDSRANRHPCAKRTGR